VLVWTKLVTVSRSSKTRQWQVTGFLGLLIENWFKSLRVYIRTFALDLKRWIVRFRI